MGMIKIPKKSIDFFNSNLSDIFETGFLAEGKWNKKLNELIKYITNATNTIPTNSNGAGIVALLTIYRHIYKRTKVLVQSNTMYGVKVMVPGHIEVGTKIVVRPSDCSYIEKAKI